MKNLKILLPMLAFIFAIGMAFAIDHKEEPAVKVQSDYVYLGNNNWQAIPEQECQGTAKTCQVRAGEGGPFLDVYDEMDLSTVKQAPPEHQPPVINF